MPVLLRMVSALWQRRWHLRRRGPVAKRQLLGLLFEPVHSPSAPASPQTQSLSFGSFKSNFGWLRWNATSLVRWSLEGNYVDAGSDPVRTGIHFAIQVCVRRAKHLLCFETNKALSCLVEIQ